VVLILEKREAKKAGEAEPASTTSPTASSPADPAPSSSVTSLNSSLHSPNSITSAAVTEDKKDTFIAVLAGTVDRLIQRLTEDVDGKSFNP